MKQIWKAFVKTYSIGGVIFIAGLLIAAIVSMLIPEAAGEREQRIAKEALYQKQITESRTKTIENMLRISALCKAKNLCPDYAKVRQECAIAGNYKMCMEIKLGQENYLESGKICTPDGQVNYPSDKVPWWPECLKAWLDGASLW
jgi:hypothetical protein